MLERVGGVDSNLYEIQLRILIMDSIRKNPSLDENIIREWVKEFHKKEPTNGSAHEADELEI